MLSGAALVIAVSDTERRQLLALGVPSSRIEIVPNPIDLSEFEPPIQRGQFRRRLRLGARRVVLFLGKLTPRKRVDVLVEAMAMLPREDVILVKRLREVETRIEHRKHGERSRTSVPQL